jgi:hypothetical protein
VCLVVAAAIAFGVFKWHQRRIVPERP